MANMALRLVLPKKPSGNGRSVPGVGSIVEGIEVLWARARQPVVDMLERSGLMDRIGEDHVYLKVDNAVLDYLKP